MHDLKKKWNINDDEYHWKIAKKIKHKIMLLKFIYVTLNILILLAALSSAWIAIYVTAYLSASLPNWYPYLTAGVGSITTLITSLINFYLVVDKIKKHQVAYNRIVMEINRFETKLMKKYGSEERKWHLFLAIEAILGNEAAKLEVINE